MSSTLKPKLMSDMKSSMKSGDKQRLGVIRLMLAAIKQIEVDERIEPDDTRILAVLDKMAKQRRESISHYSDAGRDDLVAVEQAEIDTPAIDTDAPYLSACRSCRFANTGLNFVKQPVKIPAQ